MVRALRAELIPDRVRQQVGNAVDRDVAISVAEHDRAGDVRDRGAQVDARQLAQPGAEAEPHRRVVVAAGEDHRDPGGGEVPQGAVQQRHGVRGRHRPVVDVTGYHDGVGLVADRLGQQPL